MDNRERIMPRTKLKIILIIIVCLLSMTLGLIFLWPTRALTQIVIDGADFTVKVADTEQAREQGLSGQKGLEDREGMLFVFDKPDSYMFWMKGMSFPLDIIYIRQGRIVDMGLNLPPPRSGESPVTFTPQEPADHVLEVNAGTAAAMGWHNGSIVRYLF